MVKDDAVAIVQDAYGDFGRGDIATLLTRMTDDIVWDTPGAGTSIPYAGVRRGKAEVAGFFQTLASTVEFHDFSPREFISNGEAVVALGTWDATVKATGVRVQDRWAMLFRIRDGKVYAFTEYSDARPLDLAFSAPKR